jgi:Ca2+-transporting ATPase
MGIRGEGWPSQVRPVHVRVHGRARFGIEGLYRSEELRELLAARLTRRREIVKFSINTATGNLLVHYNSNHDSRSIAAVIADLLTDASGRSDRPTTQAESPAASNSFGNTGANSPASRLVPAAPMPRAASSGSDLIADEDLWHRLPASEIGAMLEANLQSGLSVEEARRRLKAFGPNSLPEPAPRSKLGMLVGQFTTLPVALLGVAAGLSVFTAGVLDAAVIMGVMGLNALIGFFTENQAERTIHSLRRLRTPVVEAVRDGAEEEVSAEELVVGDVLVLKPGDFVPADCRLLDADYLSVDESALTGESLPVFKHDGVLADPDLPLSERRNMAYMGTVVTGGRARALVVGTGVDTEIGRIQAMLGETVTPKAPIERQLQRVGNQLILIGVGVCGVIFLMGFARGLRLLYLTRLSVSLAAAAVPEGLPTAATTSLALGISRMREHRVLIRRLPAVETMGAIQTVCFDKTGTITRNQMTVVRLHTGMRRFHTAEDEFRLDEGAVNPLDYRELRRIIRVGVLCSETKIHTDIQNGDHELVGSSTENALIKLAGAAGIDPLEVRAKYPTAEVTERSEDRHFMTTLHTKKNGRKLFAMKGNPAEVLSMCGKYLVDGEEAPLSEEHRAEILQENDRMTGDALRVLGFAQSRSQTKADFDTTGDLTWLGLVGMADPVRAGVRELIERFHRAGIETVMLTGDQKNTARAVAEAVGLDPRGVYKVMDAPELAKVDPERIPEVARDALVFCRVSPAHKLRIVRALQSGGRIVAMTGDGVNDGPALKAADVGIAMGKAGTDTAKEVADVILGGDELETLVTAVRDGRTIRGNLKKSVHYALSTNLSEIMLMFVTTAVGVGAPLNAMQLLWINLISDIFPGLALSMEAPEPDVLNRPPRDSNAPLISGADYRRMTLESGVITSAALAGYGFGFLRYGAGIKAGTLAFQTLSVAQLLHALSCRSKTKSIYAGNGLPRNRWLDVALSGSLALQALTVFVPGLRAMLGLAPLGLTDLLVVLGASAAGLFVNEGVKAAFRPNGTTKAIDGEGKGNRPLLTA